MKRSLKKLIWSTTAAAAALGFSSCRNIAPTVYGPPPSDVTSPAEESTASNSAPAAESSKAEETSAAAETSAAEETSLPAESTTAEETEGAETSAAPETPADIDPTANVVAPVYGPPGDVMTAPDPAFDPAENIPVDVYGPPSFWEDMEDDPKEAGSAVHENEEMTAPPLEDDSAEVGFHPDNNVTVTVYGPPPLK